MDTFKAIVVNKENNRFSSEIKALSFDKLMDGDVVIEVHYSSINYKDCLACSEDGKIIRQYPHIPGIDLSGVVISSLDDRFKAGDKVIATSYEIGVTHFGGFSQLAKLKADWMIPLPANLSLREAMIIGTAGITAALSIIKLEQNGLNKSHNTVLVTGATGGVGSHAIAMLAKLGYNVTAATRKIESETYLKQLGAKHIIHHSELIGDKIKPLDNQLWDGAIDAVGGKTLAAIVSKLKYGASVAVSGLTGGTTVETTVFPFILRGVNILGIDSVYYPLHKRIQLWHKIADEMKPNCLDLIVNEEITLEEIPAVVSRLLNGQAEGRCIVNMKK